MEEFDIEIKNSQVKELDFLHSEFSPNNLVRYHHKRHEIQKNGEGVYLIAWHEDKPIGHFLLRFKGPEKDTSGKYPFPTPYLEAGSTRSEYRKKGVATKLIQQAEKIVLNRGINRIGLAVGSSDNPNARRLYEKLGYFDWLLSSNVLDNI